MTFSPTTETLLERCKQSGLNLWPMIHIFKRRSKLKPEIPDDVIQAVCREYLSRKGTIKRDFPYFLIVLKKKSEEYFAKQNAKEGELIKKEPVNLRVFLQALKGAA